MSCKNILSSFSIVALMVAAPSIVCADTESDRRIVASKAYVDTKQPIQIGAAGPDSTDAGKLVVVDTNGQIAMGTSTVTDLDNKQDKDTTASAGEIGVFNASGSTVDSNKSFDGASGTISTTDNTALVPTSAQVQGYAEALSNKSSSIATDTGSTTKYPNVAAVEGYAVAKAQSTGYQILTTGTTGTVTPDYLKVPIAAGAPSATVIPSGVAQVWLEQAN